jgi:hypothetical protein
VESLLKKYPATGSVAKRPRSRWPKKLSKRHERSLLHAAPCTTAIDLAKERKMRDKLTISTEMIRRVLQDIGMNGSVSLKKPFREPQYKFKNLHFAKEHIAIFLEEGLEEGWDKGQAFPF